MSDLFAPSLLTHNTPEPSLQGVMMWCGNEVLLKIYMYSIDHKHHNNGLILTCKMFASALTPLRSAAEGASGPHSSNKNNAISLLTSVLEACGEEILLKIYMYSVDHVHHNNSLILTCKAITGVLTSLRSALIMRSFRSDGHKRNPKHAIECIVFHIKHIEVSYECTIHNHNALINVSVSVQVPSYYSSTAHNNICYNNGGSIRALTIVYNGHTVVFHYRDGGYVAVQGKGTSAHDRKAMLFVQKYLPVLYNEVMRTSRGRVLRISRYM